MSGNFCTSPAVNCRLRLNPVTKGFESDERPLSHEFGLSRTRIGQFLDLMKLP